MLNKLFSHDSPERADGLVPVAKLKDLALGRLKRVVVKGQAIVLTLVAQNGREGAYDVVAFSAICPHSLGDLSQGWVDNEEVDCPVHYYRYSLRSGECTYPKGGPRLLLYPVTVEGNDILIKVEPPKWMDGAGS